jgi:hypothetical protein
MPRSPSGKRKVSSDGTVTVHGKTGNGDGSVYFETSRGSWRATYCLPGESRVRVVRAKTRSAAVERRDLALAAHKVPAGSVSAFSGATTVAQLAEWWLKTEARQSVRPSSFGAISNSIAARWARQRAGVGAAFGTGDDVEVGTARSAGAQHGGGHAGDVEAGS